METAAFHGVRRLDAALSEEFSDGGATPPSHIRVASKTVAMRGEGVAPPSGGNDRLIA